MGPRGRLTDIEPLALPAQLSADKEADLAMKLDPGLFHWFAAAMLAAASSFAHAQSCDAPMPAPGAPTPVNGQQKWRLIADQCDVLAEPATTQRAAQLDLYKGGSVTVGMPGAGPAPAP